MRAEKEKLKAMADCKQAGSAFAVVQKQVKLWKEQQESVRSARREANTAKRAADVLREELARSEKR